MNLNLMGCVDILYVLIMVIYSKNISTIKRNSEVLLNVSVEVGLEVNAENSEDIFMSHYQNAGQNHSINIANGSFENVASSHVWEWE
jgi:hypothetical protein